MDSAIRYDVSGRYAVAYEACSGKRLGWVVSAQPNGASAMLTTTMPDDLDESMTERIVEMTRARVQIAREIERESGLQDLAWKQDVKLPSLDEVPANLRTKMMDLIGNWVKPRDSE